MPLTLDKLRQALPVIRRAAWRTVIPLDNTEFLNFSPTPVSLPSSLADAPWQPIRRGDTWGERWQTLWLRQAVEIGPELRDQQVYLHLRYREESNQWSPDVIESQVFVGDLPLAGLDGEHRLALLPQLDGPTDVYLMIHTAQAQPFGGVELVLIDEPTHELYHWIRVTLETLEQIDARSVSYQRLIHAINTAYNALDLREGSGAPRFYQSVPDALESLIALLPPEQAAQTRPRIVAVGHAHIDVAWLWPLWRTRQKAAHTFSTALRLMDQYPELQFTASTPQLYDFVKRDYPALYERIKQRVAEGRWEPIGGMWLEADCNIPNGESLVRQFVFGMRFLHDEFGIRDRVLWLPDVFGYSAALPQIMRGCDIDTFMTTKISWSEFNRMPFDTFRWHGIDGSHVLTHFVTTPDPVSTNTYYTYNGPMRPKDLAGAWNEYRQKAINDELLYIAGFGDGGGGPTAEMLETARRMDRMPDMPAVAFGSARSYFDRLQARLADEPRLPVWTGELYLEFHRGTYTSQAWIKRANRRAEQQLHDLEFLDALAATVAPGYTSQRAAINDIWQILLLNQFHDILPGSSISLVYDEARTHFAAIDRQCAELRSVILHALVPGDRPVAINTLGWERRDPIVVDASWQAVLEASIAPVQPILGWDGQRALLVAGTAAPGYAAIDLAGGTPTQLSDTPLIATPQRLENQFFRIAIDERGELESIWDMRAEREILAAGQPGNRLIAYEDRPLNYDAWNIDLFYEEKPYPIVGVERITAIERGPIRAGVEIVRRFLGSTIRQRILIYRDLPRIDFQTLIDWNEHQMLLKAAFPVDINATRATHEVQFGAIERPTHRNTTWDVARFETCMYRWIDLAEDGYGVALLNDSKYGSDIHNGTMRLTLLKSGVSPDPNADIGRHEFTYALLPHRGDWRDGQVVRRAAELNTPLVVAPPDRSQASSAALAMIDESFVTCDAPHVVIDTIKTAEDGDGIVVRMYETHNRRGPIALRFGVPIRSAELCNLLEERSGEAAIDGATIAYTIRPFEIVTFRVRLGHN